jgi:hypothetical protein
MTTAIATQRRWRLISAIKRMGMPINKPIHSQDTPPGGAVSMGNVICQMPETTASARRSP